MGVFRAKRMAAERLYDALDLPRLANAALGTNDTVGDLGAQHVEFLRDYYTRLPSLAVGVARSRVLARFVLQDADGFASRSADGGVLVASHSGHFDFAAAFVGAELGKRVAIPIRRFRSPLLNAYFEIPRRASGVCVVPDTRLRFADLTSRIEDGQVVILTLDRSSIRERRSAFPVRWLERQAKVRGLAERLATSTGCVVHAAHVRSTATGNMLTIGPGRAAASCRPDGQLTQALVEDLGASMVRAPWEWHVPLDFAELPWGAESLAEIEVLGRDSPTLGTVSPPTSGS